MGLPLLVLVQCLTADCFPSSRVLASKNAPGSAAALRAGVRIAGLVGCVARHGGPHLALVSEVEGPEPPEEQDGSMQRLCAECEVDLTGRTWYMGLGHAHCSQECLDAARRRRQPPPPSRS